MTAQQQPRTERMHIPVWLFAAVLGLGGGGLGSNMLGTKLNEKQVEEAAERGTKEALREFETRLRSIETRVAVLENGQDRDMQAIREALTSITASIRKGGT